MDLYCLTETEGEQILKKAGVIDSLSKGCVEEIAPKWDDLARLYISVRHRKPFQVLEFGSGFSTIVIAYGLKQNWIDYLNILDKQKKIVTKCYEPCIISIESSKKFLKNTQKKINDADLFDFSKIVFSEVSISEHQGQLCHFYDHLPDIVPDFVYIDGPARATVKGEVNGLSFQSAHRTVMSGDLLRYESTLLPGFFMIIDGRTNNARFLQRMLKRSYKVQYHESADVTTFEMEEPRLWIKNVYGFEAYTCSSVAFAGRIVS